MAIKTFHSSTVTLLDRTDERKLEIYISSNHPTVQIYNSNNGEYTPDWSTTNLILSADVYLDSTDITSKATIAWYKQGINDTAETKLESTTIYSNVLTSTNMVMTYICRVEYQGLTALSKITFSRIDTGKDGSDGTSITVDGTAYYDGTLSEEMIGQLISLYEDENLTTPLDTSTMVEGDSYIVQGYMCVYSPSNDKFVCAGMLQGPAGKDAKSIILTGSTQVFKINNINSYTPATISVAAQTINTTITSWTYSTNGGQTFLSTEPNGVVRNGDIVTITGATLISNSLVIKCSDGQYSDIFTIYKVFDGTDGTKGIDGQSVSMAFLTNENISFAANASGQVATTAFTTNVVAYTGIAKVTPTIGTITGLPTGMTVSAPVTTANEQILTFSIANNSNLGSASSNNGTITIPITSPVSTNLKLSWSKINTGATGVGISSTTVDYGVSDSSSTQPTTWQTTIPTVEDGKYLWTRTIIDYTDPAKQDTVTYTYAKQGSKGATGTAGSSVTVSSIQYQEGSSATVAPTGTWSNAVVAVAEGMYLWTKTTFSDGKVAYGVAKQGADGAVGVPGASAVTFQIYSSNGYALSTNTPTVTLQTFAYIGDIEITAGATYQWYVYNDTGWTEVFDGANAYLTVTREDVEFSKSYMCKMTFNGTEYTSVATIDDKNDENKVFTTKPSNYSAGDLWIVGVDYVPSGIEIGTLLRAEHTNVTYSDNDWITATKYDEKINALQNSLATYNQYFSFDSADGLKISARDENGIASKFSTSLTNERLSFNYGNESIAYINGTKMNIKEAEIESPLTITGKYSGNTMLQAPVINIGNFSIIVESNGSLSIVANT